MSYCRWSDDDFKSDVYAYESVSDGYVIHLARVRVDGEVPALPLLENNNHLEWIEAYKAQREVVNRLGRVPIGLPYDGKSFSEDTLEDFIERLLELREMGYHVPQHALDMALEEQAE